MSQKPLVLILCTGNSCRSQMAEAILRAEAGNQFEVASAGSKPAGYVHPLALKALEEIGIPHPAPRSKSLQEFLNRTVDVVITVCSSADSECPAFPGQSVRHHWPFDDPAKASGSEEERMAEFRRVREEIRRVFSAYAAGWRDASAKITAEAASPTARPDENTPAEQPLPVAYCRHFAAPPEQTA